MSDPLTDNDLHLVPTSGSTEFTGFAVELAGRRIGTVALQHLDGRTAAIRWNVNADGPGKGKAFRALRLAVDFAFATLGITRVETRIASADLADIRQASIAGLRREGVIRGSGEDADQILLARLVDDPEPFSGDGFIAILNAGLPTKRVISQGLLRDEAGRVLLCELTYKKEWDLPGGVVEPGEAPAAGLVRELQEELGITVEVHGLVTVNWLPAWRSWDDACIFVFDLGTVDASIIDGMTLQPTEIRSVHWCDPALITSKATGATVELLGALESGDVGPYREAPLAD